MSNNMTQKIKRQLSSRRQLTIPAEFTDGVDAYLIEESASNQDTPALTLHPIMEGENDN